MRIVLLLRPDRIRLASSPRLRALFQPLVLVDSMNHLRPKIAGGVVALVDTLVQPFNCSIDSALAVLLDQSCTDSTTVAASNGFFQVSIYLNTRETKSIKCQFHQECLPSAKEYAFVRS
jgi:hypothetical protein